MNRLFHVPTVSSDVAIEDWDVLFGAVTDRLRFATSRPSAAADLLRLKMSVLECVEALEQLRATATHELDRLQDTSAVRDEGGVAALSDPIVLRQRPRAHASSSG